MRKIIIKERRMNKACKVSLEDLEKQTLEHYEKLSNESHEWLNTIPRAIKLYFKWRKFKEKKEE